MVHKFSSRIIPRGDIKGAIREGWMYSHGRTNPSAQATDEALRSYVEGAYPAIARAVGEAMGLTLKMGLPKLLVHSDLTRKPDINKPKDRIFGLTHPKKIALIRSFSIKEVRIILAHELVHAHIVQNKILLPFEIEEGLSDAFGRYVASSIANSRPPTSKEFAWALSWKLDHLWYLLEFAGFVAERSQKIDERSKIKKVYRDLLRSERFDVLINYRDPVLSYVLAPFAIAKRLAKSEDTNALHVLRDIFLNYHKMEEFQSFILKGQTANRLTRWQDFKYIYLSAPRHAVPTIMIEGKKAPDILSLRKMIRDSKEVRDALLPLVPTPKDQGRAVGI